MMCIVRGLHSSSNNSSSSGKQFHCVYSYLFASVVIPNDDSGYFLDQA